MLSLFSALIYAQPPNVTITCSAGTTDVPLSGLLTIEIDNGYIFDTTAINYSLFAKKNASLDWLSTDTVPLLDISTIPQDTITSGLSSLSFYIIEKVKYDSSEVDHNNFYITDQIVFQDSVLNLSFGHLKKDTEYILVVDSLEVYNPNSTSWHKITGSTLSFTTVSSLPSVIECSIEKYPFVRCGDTITVDFTTGIDSLSFSGNNVVSIKILDSIDSSGLHHYSEVSHTQWFESSNTRISTKLDASVSDEYLLMNIDMFNVRGDNKDNRVFEIVPKTMDYVELYAVDTSFNRFRKKIAFGYDSKGYRTVNFGDTITIKAATELDDYDFDHFRIYADSRQTSSFTVDSSSTIELVGGDCTSPFSRTAMAVYKPKPSFNLVLNSNPNVTYAAYNSSNVLLGTSGTITVPKSSNNIINVVLTPTGGTGISTVVIGPDTIRDGVSRFTVDPTNSAYSSNSASVTVTSALSDPKSTGDYEITIRAWVRSVKYGFVPATGHDIKDILNTSDPDIDSGTEWSHGANVTKTYLAVDQDYDIEIEIDDLVGPTGCNCYALQAVYKDGITEWEHPYDVIYAANGNKTGPYKTLYTDVASLSSSNRKIVYDVIVGRKTIDYDIDVELLDGTTLPVSIDFLIFEEGIKKSSHPELMLQPYIVSDIRDIEDDVVNGNQQEISMKLQCGDPLTVSVPDVKDLQYFYYLHKLEQHGVSDQTNSALEFEYRDLGIPGSTSRFINTNNSISIDETNVCEDRLRGNNKQSIFTFGAPNILFIVEGQHRFNISGNDEYTEAYPFHFTTTGLSSIVEPTEFRIHPSGSSIVREQITTGRHSFGSLVKAAVPRFKFNKKIDFSSTTLSDQLNIYVKNPSESYYTDFIGRKIDWSEYAYVDTDDESRLYIPIAHKISSTEEYIAEKGATIQFYFKEDKNNFYNAIHAKGNVNQELAGDQIRYDSGTEFPIISLDINTITYYDDPDDANDPQPILEFQMYVMTLFEFESYRSFEGHYTLHDYTLLGDGNTIPWTAVNADFFVTGNAYPKPNNVAPYPNYDNKVLPLHIGFAHDPSLHSQWDEHVFTIDLEALVREVLESSYTEITDPYVTNTQFVDLFHLTIHPYVIELDNGGFYDGDIDIDHVLRTYGYNMPENVISNVVDKYSFPTGDEILTTYNWLVDMSIDDSSVGDNDDIPLLTSINDGVTEYDLWGASKGSLKPPLFILNRTYDLKYGNTCIINATFEEVPD